MYWECHITLGLHPVSSKDLVEALGWKFSCIDGDPQLGSGAREYATRNASSVSDFETVKTHMNYTADVLKRTGGFNVIRQKIELVMYDTKGKEK